MKYYIILPSLMVFNLYSAVTSSPMPFTPKGAVTVVQSQGDKELSWVDEQIKAILPARSGVPDAYINALVDPVKYLKPVATPGKPGSKLLAPPRLGGLSAPLLPPKIVEEPLKLNALFNKSALVNGKWYKVNDTIRNYTLIEIKSNSILLNGPKDQKLILFLSKPNNNIKITTK